MSRLSSPSRLLLGVIEDVPLGRITAPFHSLRQDSTDTIRELASSIDRNGLLQPIVVRLRGEFYEVVAGYRRFQACRRLGWRKIACHVVEMNDKEAFEVAIIENLQRKTLSPIEEAYAFKAYVSDFGWGGLTELAGKIGRSVAYVTKRIKLLNLPSNILDSIINHRMAASVAEELISIKDKRRQSELGQLVSQRRMSLRNVRKLLKEADKEFDIESACQIPAHAIQVNRIHRQTERIFDRSIVALRIAMNRLGTIIEDAEKDWILYEILMQHRNALHAQIDLLIKEKIKLRL